MFSCGWFSWNSDRMDILGNTEFGLSFKPYGKIQYYKVINIKTY